MWRFICFSIVIWIALITLTESKKCKTCSSNSKKVDLNKIIQNLENYAIDDDCKKSEECARNWMDFYNSEYEKIVNKLSNQEFDLNVNLNEENQRRFVELDAISNNFITIAKNKSQEFQISDSWDETLRRELNFAKKAILIEVSFNNQQDKILYSTLSKKMEYIYGTAKVCENQTCLSLDPELTSLMRSSRDYNKLLWAWKGWHDATGPKMRDIYTETVSIRNKAVKENGYKDLSEKWMEDFEDPSFEKLYDDLFAQIKPLYEQLHAYARRKLKDVYGSNYPQNHNPQLIPAHLLGNMWAQTWDNIYELLTPYPDVKPLNLTKNLLEQNYTVDKIFKTSEEFFTSIGLFSMTPTFWKKSLFVKPEGREVQCHASAFDFYVGYDYRVKMCTTVTEEDFYVVHHEMGHIEYFMAYKDQPIIFKGGANSGFHEAIGDTIALSVGTSKHLKAIGLIEDDAVSKEQELNFLMSIALQKLSFLPFGYLMDKWRWDVFRGKINDSNYNQKWWEMRSNYQGVEAPIERSEEYFDPGAKYHIPSNVPYARYFVSAILQFQFYKSLCTLSDHQGPLYNCDFYGSKQAGEKFKNMLELGSSKHWSKALEVLTNQTTMSADALFEYFKPLYDWLVEENLKFPNDKPGF